MVRDDDLPLLQEFVGHAYTFIQQSARIAAQIKDQAFQIAKALQRVFHFLFRGFVKRRHVHVADARPHQEFQVNAVARDLVADHVEFQWLLGGLAQNRNVNVGAFWPFEQIGHIAHAHVVRGFGVDGNDHVARPQPGFVRRRSREWGHDNNLVVARGNLHAHAVILAALFFTQQRI